jgi:hypothetical protein
MRITHNPPDEHKLRTYLQDGSFDKAIEVIDWYYSSRNPEGFDDPNDVIRGKDIVPKKPIQINSTETINIKKSKGQWIFILSFLNVALGFFAYLSIDSGSWSPLKYSIPIIGVLIVLVLRQLFDKESQVRLTSETLEFKKSEKAPIRWDNILSVYLYSRNAGRFNTHFIIIWKKDSVKPESFIVDNLDIDPATIGYLIETFTNETEKRKVQL